MTVSLLVMSAGHGYQYALRLVTCGDGDVSVANPNLVAGRHDLVQFPRFSASQVRSGRPNLGPSIRRPTSTLPYSTLHEKFAPVNDHEPVDGRGRMNDQGRGNARRRSLSPFEVQMRF